MSDGLDAAGALVTAGLAAGTIESAHGGKGGAAPGSAAHDGSAHGACLNCGAALHGTFCQSCGQPAHVHRSLLHLVEELLHGLFHFDAKGWRTLPLLVAKPGVLTRRYIDGQRVRYVSPLALFLFTVFLMFFVASLSGGEPVNFGASDEARAELDADLAKADVAEAKAQAELAAALKSGVDIEAKTEALADAKSDIVDARMAINTVDAAASAAAARMATSAGDASSGAAGNATGINVVTKARAAHRPGVSVQLAKGYSSIRFLDRTIKHAFANPDLTIYKLKNSAYKYSFMLVPISLPFVWLLFLFRRDVTAYDHAVFVLYSLSFMSMLFIALVLLGAANVPGAFVVALALLVPPVHIGLQLRDTYRLGLGGTLWRTAALLVVAAIVSLLFIFFVAYVALG